MDAARGRTAAATEEMGVTDGGPAARAAQPGQRLASPGSMAVDYEQRVDFPRLRAHRLASARRSLDASECGAFLLFDFYNIRYVTQTWIGGALGDKMSRYALLARGEEPYIWDFGSAARHHQLFAPGCSACGARSPPTSA